MPNFWPFIRIERDALGRRIGVERDWLSGISKQSLSSDLDRPESIGRPGNAIFLVLCTIPLWMGWQVREIRALGAVQQPQQCSPSGKRADQQLEPELPMRQPMPPDGISNAARQWGVDPSGNELPRRPEAISESAKHPHAVDVSRLPATPHLPVSQPSANPAEGEHTRTDANDHGDVRRGGTD